MVVLEFNYNLSQSGVPNCCLTLQQADREDLRKDKAPLCSFYLLIAFLSLQDLARESNTTFSPRYVKHAELTAGLTSFLWKERTSARVRRASTDVPLVNAYELCNRCGAFAQQLQSFHCTSFVEFR